MIKQDRGTPFSVTSSGTGGLLTLTQTAGTNVIYYVTDISATASSSMGTWVLYAYPTTTQGTTTLWQGTGTVNYHFSEPQSGWKGGAVVLTAAGTLTIYGNMSGFYLTA